MSVRRDIIVHIDFCNGYHSTGYRTITEGVSEAADAQEVYGAMVSVIQDDLQDDEWNQNQWNLGDALYHVECVSLIDLDDHRIVQFRYFPVYFAFTDPRAFPDHKHFSEPNVGCRPRW